MGSLMEKRHMEQYLLQRGLSTRKPFRCLSPLHEDKHPSMSYNPKAGNVHCFACGVTYDVLDLIGIDYNLNDFSEQYGKACELFGLSRPALSYKKINSGRVSERQSGFTPTGVNEILPSVPADLPAPPEKQKGLFVSFSPKEKERSSLPGRATELTALEQSASGSTAYLESRGISRESCRRYRLFEYEGRAYFPVFAGGDCVSWTARAISDALEPRYKNTAGPMGIWNGDVLERHGGGRTLYITEGIIDAILLCQTGREAVALCGSQNVAKLLRRLEANPQLAHSRRYVAAGDPDDAGRRMNAALCEGLGALGLDCGTLELAEQDGDIAELYGKDRERLAELLESGAPVTDRAYSVLSAAENLDAFFVESARRVARGAVSTGFPSLDKLLDGGLYPGLYVMGAISSLGKTSFLLQVADTIAANDTDVLFFSLEQSKFELMAKSLSRTSALLDRAARKDAFTVRQFLGGGWRDSFSRRQLLADTRDVYAQSARGLFIREGIADIGTAHIREAVREHIAQRGRTPVVMVDYLQILAPADARATDKQNTDRAVVELKRISRDFDLPLVAVSSFNRENYRVAVSMEAFKESGAVEYSSDVLLGLQLLGAGMKEFDVNAAKGKEPRALELVLLKNRSGVPYAKVPLRYTAKFGLFEEG